MRIAEQIEIKAPIVDCYELGITFDRYHEILNNIKSIKKKGYPDTWHWEVEGPNGKLLEWDVEVRGKKHNNQVISWHTIRQGDIAHSGAVVFNQINKATTLVQLVIEYSASSDAYPNGKDESEQYGHRLIGEFLQSFKGLVEPNKGAVLPPYPSDEAVGEIFCTAKQGRKTIWQ